MQSVGTHQGKEGREKGAAGRSRAKLKHVTELADLETQKRDTQNKGDRHPKISGVSVSALHGERAKTAGDARGQQASGLDQHVLLVEQVGGRWATGGFARQYRERGKER